MPLAYLANRLQARPPLSGEHSAAATAPIPSCFPMHATLNKGLTGSAGSLALQQTLFPG